MDADVSGLPGLPKPFEEAAAQRNLRDLLGLLTLPALWAGRDAATVLQLMTEAVERIVGLDMSYVDVQLMPEQAAIKKLRLSRGPASDEDVTAWESTLHEFRHMAISSAPRLYETPVGRLRVIRLSMGYSAQRGSVWFGSADPTFPLVTHLACLRAAATLAATGLQTARIEHERERASRAKDEFLAMLGHELRNPLAPIFTSLELIKRQSTEPLSRPHAVIERQARHLSRLVDDLLDVSRIAHGKIDLDKQLVDLRSILANALEAVAPLLDQRGHEVTTALPDVSGQVLGDATRLTQIFSNLLTNAAKYTPVNGKIWLETRVEGERVVVCIRDNGVGISAGLMPRLFHIFEQDGSTIDRSGGGLGIGLALVQNFVQLHGGTVKAASDGPGTGSSFTVTLPLSAPIAHAPVPATVELQAPDKSNGREALRVMLVDDNVDAIETMAEILRFSGFDVATALDPVEALALAESFKPEAAILDIGLPGMDGYQLAAELRRRLGTQPLRLMALSGYGLAQDYRQSANAGFERHLVKPVDCDELIALLSAPPSR